jgi:hypothetical protein
MENPPAVPELELSQDFFKEIVEPILDEMIPDLAYTAALIGSGSEVIVTDQVGFIDQGQQGTFFELTDRNCRVGAFVMNQDWEQVPQEYKDQIKTGSTFTIFGALSEFEGELEINVFIPAFEDTGG